MSDEKDFLSMPSSMKPTSMQPVMEQQKKMDPKVPQAQPKKMSRGKFIAWVIVIVILVIGLVQYINAAKYSALVQVISQDRIGVNPTGNALDFGDLPRNKSAVRTVELKSSGNTASYIMVWMFGGISDLLKVDQNYFTLQPHSDVKLQFTATIPNSAPYQYFKGSVVIFQIPKVW
jgi:hypothetical protein